MRRTVLWAGLVLALSSLAANAATVIKAAHTGNVKQKYHAAMELFRDLVEERSNGRFTVDIYPATMGGDRELIESLQIGTVDFAELNTSVLATIAPRLGVYDLPYIFRDRGHAHRVLDGEIGTELMREMQEKSTIIGLGYW
ncbi:MAG: TRAP transporter substrate-binding protein DctP, partial [Planctomycetes bacterium]|nr:TRAP transporter substrate-binding protein DctP [Planctomycetota bacterium]